jgi:diacylglycerol kinase (ATP)
MRQILKNLPDDKISHDPVEKTTKPGVLIVMSRSFRNAFNGVGVLFGKERNARIHLTVFCGVVTAGVFFCLTAFEWIIILVVSSLVFAAEAINTSIETLADVVSPKIDPQIKLVKDIAAGAVLLTAIAAAVVGLIVFIPKIITFFF